MNRGNVRAILAVITAFALIALIHQIRPHTRTAPDFSCGGGTGEVIIDVSAGESGASIASKLVAAGVTQSSSAFFRTAVADSRSGSIAPGSHRIERHLCAREALEQLLDSRRIANLISIVEGEWNREIVASLVGKTYTQNEVNAALRKVSIPQGFSSLEGLLFPAQYSFDTSKPLSDAFEAIVQRGLSELKAAGAFNSAERFTPSQLLTIASLVQAEGNTKDYAKISRVVRNRLTIGMPLQFDSTVHYVKGSRGSMFLSTQSTLLNSPYNTYRHYGLPPAPINNPGRAAMDAAVHPAAGNWIYFITVAPGDTRFTDSLDQFNSWKSLYKSNLRKGLFRKSS